MQDVRADTEPIDTSGFSSDAARPKSRRGVRSARARSAVIIVAAAGLVACGAAAGQTPGSSPSSSSLAASPSARGTLPPAATIPPSVGVVAQDCLGLGLQPITPQVWRDGCREDSGVISALTVLPCQSGPQLLILSDGTDSGVLYGESGDFLPNRGQRAVSDLTFVQAVSACTA
jgi:hypothetical protein